MQIYNFCDHIQSFTTRIHRETINSYCSIMLNVSGINLTVFCLKISQDRFHPYVKQFNISPFLVFKSLFMLCYTC